MCCGVGGIVAFSIWKSYSEIIVCKICLAKLDIEGKWGKCLASYPEVHLY